MTEPVEALLNPVGLNCGMFCPVQLHGFKHNKDDVAVCQIQQNTCWQPNFDHMFTYHSHLIPKIKAGSHHGNVYLIGMFLHDTPSPCSWYIGNIAIFLRKKIDKDVLEQSMVKSLFGGMLFDLMQGMERKAR